MRYLVTGGAGFIGSALVRMLVRDPACTVFTLDALTYAGTLQSLRDVKGAANHEFLHADICDADAVRAAFSKANPDRVIHLAAESHVDRSIGGAEPFLQTNIVGTFRLLEAARAHRDRIGNERATDFRFLHVSTDEVFGSLGADGAFEERTPYDPSSPYSASKAAADHLVMAWGRTYGLPVLVSNCSNNYGPYHFPEKLIPLTILNALEGAVLPVYGDGGQVRDWLYVDDHVRALRLVCDSGTPGERYAVGGQNERRNLDVVHTICALLDELRPAARPRATLIRHVDDRPGHDRRYAIDATKLETTLGWRAQETFGSGIRKTVVWYLENEWWWRPLRDRIYRGERLGLSPGGSP